MRFSQKIGKTPVDSPLQVESADPTLRSAIWNVLYRTVLEDSFAPGGPRFNDALLDDLWEFFYKLQVDERPQAKHALVQLKHWVMNTDWYRLYDLLEFVTGSIQPSRLRAFESACNKVLERERSAFRLVRGTVLPVNDLVEFHSVLEADELLEEYGLEGCRSHLAIALTELSRRTGTPDYDLAILEAARAVRALMSDLETAIPADDSATNPGTTETPPALPEELASALKGIFAVGDRIENRHIFRTAGRPPGMAEAKFMVVTASATINFLLATSRAGERSVRPDSQRSLPDSPAPPPLIE